MIPHTAIAEARALLPALLDTAPARVMLIAIGLQESRFEHRRQILGPAVGFWQFEQGGGVAGVLRHPQTMHLARWCCLRRKVDAIPSAVYAELEHDDVLAACFARLNLWWDERPLPRVGDEQGAWDLYIRTWRPGIPHRHTWASLYRQAVEAAGPFVDQQA